MTQGFVARLAHWPAYRWVCLMLTGFFVVALATTWINYLNFHIDGIGYFDLSINQQALSSTVHSNQPYAFYEATNCGRDGRCSFLLVHPVLLAYAVSAPYAVWPSPFTLFAIQDLAIALAALPLFAIARRETGSNRISIAIVGAYLVWLPSFSGIFSFHWEAFVPLEFFLIFWLWLTDRYSLALPVVLIAYVTLEIMPVLLFFLAVFFLLPWVRPVLKLLRAELLYLRQPKSSRTPQQLTALTRIRRTLLGRPRFVASLYLLVGSAVAYIALHEFVTSGGFLLGLPPLPSQYSIPLDRPVYAASFTWQNLRKAWQSKFLYWLVIYATLAMVPLLAPRTLVLSLPWVVFSVFATSGYYRMGDQYAFVSSALLFIGFVYGIVRLRQWAAPAPSKQEWGGPADPTTSRDPAPVQPPPADLGTPAAAPTPGTTAGPPASRDAAPGWAEGPATNERPSVTPQSPRVDRTARRRRRAARASLTGVLVGVIVFSLFLSPLNPLAASLKEAPPFVPQSSLSIWGGLNTADYDHMEKLVSLIGDESIVAVSPMLFTFVANDRYAYPLLKGMNLLNLPFDAVSATQYVILLDRGGTTVPFYLSSELYNASFFGIRAWIPSTYLGPVLLFERGYTGPTEVLGNAPVFTGATYTAGAGLEPGTKGIVAANSSSQSGSVIETAPVPGQAGTQQTGKVFLGPDVALPGGSYEVKVVLNGSVTHSSSKISGSAPVVSILISGYQVKLHREVLNLSRLSGEGWNAYTFNFTLPYPVLGFTVAGYNQKDWYAFKVDYVSITPVPS